jgi:hypothetical protein
MDLPQTGYMEITDSETFLKANEDVLPFVGRGWTVCARLIARSSRQLLARLFPYQFFSFLRCHRPCKRIGLFVDLFRCVLFARAEANCLLSLFAASA